MKAYYTYLNGLINKNTVYYKKSPGSIRWINSLVATEMENKRDFLLSQAKHQINWEFYQTKPWINKISKGCMLCGQGLWSCLFITGLCNAKCFYCPASQNKDHLPATQQLTFENANDYADYINYFGFKGVSISGGEPMLAFDRTLEFITTVRKKCSSNIYIWMYTNGILADREKFKQLANAGLNEIRFDIGAVNYKLNPIHQAKGIIEHITVEIPAVPEDTQKVIGLLRGMSDAGVTNLNLHQLRLTNHNASRLLHRDYTYLHGEQAVVMESEIAALEIMNVAIQNNINIGINYCCFQYKNRFQKAGYRNIIASKLINAKNITKKGFERNISYKDQPLSSLEEIKNIHKKMNTEKVQLIYKGFFLEDNKPLKNNGSSTIKTGGKTCYVSTYNASEAIYLDKKVLGEYIQLMETGTAEIPTSNTLFNAWKYEFIEKSWRNYF